MKETLVDSIVELLTLVVTGAGALALTALGFLAEQAGLQNLALGNIPVGIWEAGMGAVILFAGIYLIGYNQFWKRIQLLLFA